MLQITWLNLSCSGENQRPEAYHVNLVDSAQILIQQISREMYEKKQIIEWKTHELISHNPSDIQLYSHLIVKSAKCLASASTAKSQRVILWGFTMFCLNFTWNYDERG